MGDRRSFWAWCMESEEPTDADRAALAAQLSERYGTAITARPVPRAEDAQLREPRISVPDQLSSWCETSTYERAFHAYGASFTDRTRAFNLQFPNPPDVVAHPRDEQELEITLEWCDSNGYVAIPYGGGSSVVWGVNPPDDCGPCVTIALDRLDRVLEIDEVSRAARIQAGVLGPALEQQLKPSGHTLRHFPQSFRFSSLGGWIVTRSGGHYATNHTHIDDFVESIRMLTPRGWWESRRLPGSGAGPSPDRMVIGSEGILGVVTEAWMRIQKRPVVPCDRRDHVRFVAGGLRCGAHDRAGQAVARQPPHPRPGRGRARRRASTGNKRSSSSRSSRPISRNGTTSPRPSPSPAPRADTSPTTRSMSTTAAVARRGAVARSAHGATPSSVCNSASTRPSALSPTRSRPPSPGTAGPTSTPPSVRE